MDSFEMDLTGLDKRIQSGVGQRTFSFTLKCDFFFQTLWNGPKKKYAVSLGLVLKWCSVYEW